MNNCGLIRMWMVFVAAKKGLKPNPILKQPLFPQDLNFVLNVFGGVFLVVFVCFGGGLYVCFEITVPSVSEYLPINLKQYNRYMQAKYTKPKTG